MTVLKVKQVAVPHGFLQRLVWLAQDHMKMVLLQPANDGKRGAQKEYDDALRVVDAVIELLDPPRAPQSETPNEFDLHVWYKPETERMSALYTISVVGGRGVCFDMPVDAALDFVRQLLTEMAE